MPVLLLGVLSPCWGQTPVKVGGYVFPPFVDRVSVQNPEMAGLTLDLIQLFNRVQNDYQFEFVRTSPRRRYQDFEAGRFDQMFFESPAWGWDGYPVSSTEVFLTGGEVYVARAVDGRGQEYFDDLSSRRIKGFLGYHYGFAGFNADPVYLRTHHNTDLTPTHRGNILSILRDRADVAVVTTAFLSRFQQDNPSLATDLLVSERLDQPYNHSLMIRQGVSPDVSAMNELLRQTHATGALDEVLARYGLTASLQ